MLLSLAVFLVYTLNTSSIFSRKRELVRGEILSMTHSTSTAIVIPNYTQVTVARLLPISIMFKTKMLKCLRLLRSVLNIMLYDQKGIINPL